MSLGFQWAGYDVVTAFDNWDPALMVYRANFRHPAHKCDLGQPPGSDDFGRLAEHVRACAPDMVVGGPPCQDFSSAGKRDETLGRADLTVRFAEAVRASGAPWFVMENVARAAGSAAYAAAKGLLAGRYGLTEAVLDASLCGVPQARRRLFLVGEMGGVDGALAGPLLERLADRPMTVRDYLGAELGLDHYYRHPRSYRRRGVFSVDEPSPTVRGVNRPVPPGYRAHPGDTAGVEGLRPLTTAERARIQTFPPGFAWAGSKADTEQMIGNAVPPRLAEFVAGAVAGYAGRAGPARQ